MTTPHKALLIQARDALLSACGGRCNAEYNPCNYKEVADALTAAIDAPEPEPVAWIGDSPTKGNGRKLFWTRSEAYRYASNITPLYAAAGAAPFDPDASYQEHLDSTVGIDPAGAPAPEGWHYKEHADAAIDKAMKGEQP